MPMCFFLSVDQPVFAKRGTFKVESRTTDGLISDNIAERHTQCHDRKPPRS